MKWAGGKRGSLAALRRLLPAPERITGYRSTCIGGGADFFCLYSKVRPAYLSDVNEELIRVYKVARAAPRDLLACLDELRAPFLEATTWAEYDEVYFALRERTSGLTETARAARTIALNKTCHNGLFRQNRSGKFNVGPGQKGKGDVVVVPRFASPENMMRVSEALAGTAIGVRDAEEAIDHAEEGELIYVDPPYWPAKEGGFTTYTADGFSDKDQRRIAAAGLRAANRGALVAISNHDLPVTRALYERYHLTTLSISHAMSADTKTRGNVPELLACTFEPGSLT